MGVFETPTPRTCLANTQNDFTADRERLISWIGSALTANLTYYRTRREFFHTFVLALEHTVHLRVVVCEEDFITVRQFLTSRNDAVTADARLAFDRTLFKLRAACHQLGLQHAGDDGGDHTPPGSPGGPSSSSKRKRDQFTPGVHSQSGLGLRDSETVCAEVDGLSMSSHTEATGMTTMLMEACSQVDVLGKHYVSHPKGPADGSIQNLTDYFKRPVFVGTTGTFVTGTRGVVFTRELTNSSPGSVLDYFSGGSTRLSGAYGMRYKMVFTLFVAANPFHQGIICLNWQYGANSASSAIDFNRGVYSASCTNLPHVRLDLSEGTMCQLSIPFLAEEEFHRIGKTGDTYQVLPYGTLTCNTILPIPSVSGISPPTYRLTVHLEDIELVGATTTSSTSVQVQAGKPVEKEFLSSAFPFSSGLHLAGTAVSWISRGVPALSSIAGPAAWFLGKAAGVARSFGFSKPQIQDPPVRMVPVSSAAESNVDLPSATLMVAPFASNCLRIGPDLANTDVDEMSLAYVLSQWNQIFVGSLSTSTAPGQRIYITPISPSAFWFREQPAVDGGNLSCPNTCTNGSNSLMPSGLFFWSSMFRHWKGSIRLRITFAKTKLHGGRILAAFSPQQFDLGMGAATTTIPTPVNSPFADSTIFDLRDGSSFEVEIPYNTSVPYQDFTACIGTFVMYVQDALQAPGVVANNISFMVEVCAGSDYELSNLRGVMFPASVGGSIRSQSGISSLPSNTCESVVGEIFTTAKQLIMLPKATNSIFYQVFETWKNDLNTSNVSGIVRSVSSSWAIKPWWYHPKTNLSLTVAPSTAAVSPFPAEAFCVAGNISKCYAFARGSTDVHVYAHGFLTMGTTGVPATLTEASTQVPLFKTASFVGPDAGTGNVKSVDSCSSNVPTVVAADGVPLHVRFPSYLSGARTRTHYYDGDNWANMPYVGSTNNSIPDSTALGSLTVSPSLARVTITCPVVRTDTSVQIVLRASRCAGDDAQLGHYMGPPPLALPNANLVFTSWSLDSMLPIIGGIHSGGAGAYEFLATAGTPYYLLGSTTGSNPITNPSAFKAGPLPEGLISTTATVVESV